MASWNRTKSGYYRECTNEELATLYRCHRDRAALDELICRLKDDVKAIAKRAANPLAPASDLENEAWLEIIVGYGRRNIRDVEAFTRTVARNTAKRAAKNAFNGAPVAIPLELHADVSVMEVVLDRVDIETAMRTLGPDDVQLVLALVVNGQPETEVAESRGVNPGTVRVQLHRAKARLRRALV